MNIRFEIKLKKFFVRYIVQYIYIIFQWMQTFSVYDSENGFIQWIRSILHCKWCEHNTQRFHNRIMYSAYSNCPFREMIHKGNNTFDSVYFSINDFELCAWQFDKRGRTIDLIKCLNQKFETHTITCSNLSSRFHEEKRWTFEFCSRSFTYFNFYLVEIKY